MDNKIIFRSQGTIGTIIFNNPKKLNSFDFEMIEELNRILDEIKKSKLKAIVVRGSGKSFCSGGDILWERKVGELEEEKAKKQIKFVQYVFSKIERLPQIFIAVVNGHAIGGGNELAMACDIRIALPSAKFVHPETSLGTVAPLGGTKRLPRLIGLGKAKYMLFTGIMIDSKTALKWGLVDFIVPKRKIRSFLNSVLSRIAKNSGKALALTKKSVNMNYLKDLNDEFEVKAYIKCSRSKENREILDNFLGKGENNELIS